MTHDRDRDDLTRWSAAFVLVLACHVAGLLAIVTVRSSDAAGAAVPVVAIDLAPLVQTPDASAADLAPAPVEHAALPDRSEPPRPEEPPEPEAEPEPEPEEMEQTVPLSEPPPPTPPAAVVLPSEPPAVVATPRKLEKPEQKAERKPKHRKPPPPQQSSAAPRRQAMASQLAAPAPGVGNSGASLASWQGLVAAHLNRHKQYPSEARARNETGTAVLVFSINRSGSVISASLARSSGSPSLDREAASLARRASPVPAPPPGLGGSQIRLTVPIRFNVR